MTIQAVPYGYIKTADTQAVVSEWYIPGGHQYDRASVQYIFFSDMAAAKAYEERGRPPEMPVLMTIAEYEAAMDRMYRPTSEIQLEDLCLRHGYRQIISSGDVMRDCMSITSQGVDVDNLLRLAAAIERYEAGKF